MALTTQRRNEVYCHNCGKQGHLARNCRTQCPPMPTCFNCGDRGHLACNFWDQANGRGSILTQQAWNAPERKWVLASHNTLALYNTFPPHSTFLQSHILKTATCITGTINSKPTQMLLDSGASCSMVSKKHISIPDMSSAGYIKLVNADGTSFKPLGTSLMTVTLGEVSADHSFLVVDQLSIPVILGCDFMSQHGLVHAGFP